MGIGRVHRHTHSTQAFQLRRCHVRPDNSEIRPERDDALEVEPARIADARQARGLGWPVGGFEHADHPGAGTGRKEQLGRMRRKTHNTTCRRRQRDRRAAGVRYGDGGTTAAYPSRDQCCRAGRRHAHG